MGSDMDRLQLELRWLYYYHVQRKLQSFTPWVARKLPKKLKYFVVVHGMVKVEPGNDPSNVKAMQILDLWKP